MSSDETKRYCSTCKERHGPAHDKPVFHGHVMSNGAPATFQCSKCGRKAYWNTGDRVPSFSRWILNKLKGGNSTTDSEGHDEQ